MFQYCVVEMRKTDAGVVSHDTYWLSDADATRARELGDAKYFERAAVAAVSSNALHYVTLVSENGYAVRNIRYKRPVEEE